MKVTLKPKPEFDSLVDLDNITPDEFKDKEPDEIVNTPVYQGSKELNLEDIFEVECEETDDSEVEIMIDGDIPLGKRLGQDMTEGKIEVAGDVGKYAGSFMSGGEIKIEGDADSWAGQKMSGGKLVIKGDANNFLGSTYRGDWEGVTGGEIIVEGNAGDQVGEWLDGGTIKINGEAGLQLGSHMKSGNVIVKGDIGDRAGGQMEDGNIVVTGKMENLLPGFSFEEEVKNPELDGAEIEGEFLQFVGDKAEDGEGVLLLNKAENEHLT